MKKIKEESIIKFIKFFISTITILFLILGPGIFESYKMEIKNPEEKNETWKGVITIWDYPFYSKESGTKYGWLREKIRKFEKENKGVFIEFKPLDKERGLSEIIAASKIGELPDIAPVGADRQIHAMGILEELAEGNENYVPGVEKAISHQNTVYGKPRFINPVIMLLNVGKCLKNPEDLISEEALETIISSLKNERILYNYTGMFSLSLENEGKPLADEIIKKGEHSSSSQIRKAVESGNFAIILCDIMALTEYNHSMENNSQYKIINFMGDEDYIHGECIAYGIFRQDNPERLEMCKKFLGELTSEEEQKNLYHYNAFSISRDTDSLYDRNSDMGKLEHGVKELEKRFINPLSEVD